MTLEEREAAIQKILESMEDWDLDTLLDYAMGCMEEYLKGLDDKDLQWQVDLVNGDV